MADIEPEKTPPELPILKLGQGKLIGLAAATFVFVLLVLGWSLGWFTFAPPDDGAERAPAWAVPTPAQGMAPEPTRF